MTLTPASASASSCQSQQVLKFNILRFVKLDYLEQVFKHLHGEDLEFIISLGFKKELLQRNFNLHQQQIFFWMILIAQFAYNLNFRINLLGLFDNEWRKDGLHASILFGIFISDPYKLISCWNKGILSNWLDGNIAKQPTIDSKLDICALKCSYP